MAGMCGKAWHIPGSGLNLYIVLVARSAIGKEALHTGIANVVNACLSHSPIFGNFVDFTEYASGPARSEEHTSELQSLMRISYAVFCLKKKKTQKNNNNRITTTKCNITA